MAWKNYSRKCVYCGKPGPRTVVIGGYAHKRCLPESQPKPKPRPSGVAVVDGHTFSHTDADAAQQEGEKK